VAQQGGYKVGAKLMQPEQIFFNKWHLHPFQKYVKPHLSTMQDRSNVEGFKICQKKLSHLYWFK
jgi:hypothetical protein